MYYENVSSGIEPTIAWVFNRKAREADGSYKQMKEVSDYGYFVFKQVTGHKHGNPLPAYMCSALQAPLVTVDQHLAVQITAQKFIDASISKTINCPVDIPFSDFKDVYTRAYNGGLKGCTTYRPSDVRGSVISVDEPKLAPPPVVIASPIIVPAKRDEELEGTTYKVRYPGVEHAFYVTINDYYDEFNTRRPFEIFINTKSVQHQEWISALTRMVSSIFRRGGDVTFIVEELKQVYGQNGAFVNKKFVPSIVALIGTVVEKHFEKIGLLQGEPKPVVESSFKAEAVTDSMPKGNTCPECQAPSYFRTEGCWKCGSCGFSECG
jgi:ribonucleoside-diphosphate reductase alpha chain